MREKLAQADIAILNNDDARAQRLLEEAEAGALLGHARDRNRMLVAIRTRQSELGEKRARDDLDRKERAQKAPLAARESVEPLAARAEQAKPPPPAPKPAEPMMITVGDVVFDAGSAVLRVAATAMIGRLVAFLRDQPRRTVLIEGFTDSTGSDEYNLTLSERRANAVRQALVNRGVAPERTSVRGYGPAYPVVSNTDEAGRLRNHRVEILVSDEEGRVPVRQAAAPAR